MDSSLWMWESVHFASINSTLEANVLVSVGWQVKILGKCLLQMTKLVYDDFAIFLFSLVFIACG